MSHLMTGTEEDLATRLAAALGGEYIAYEPFAYESLRRANQIVFGMDLIPAYHIDQADFLLSFGANFLETWVSNVQLTRQFAAFRAPQETGKTPLRLRGSPALHDRGQRRSLGGGPGRRLSPGWPSGCSVCSSSRGGPLSGGAGTSPRHISAFTPERGGGENRGEGGRGPSCHRRPVQERQTAPRPRGGIAFQDPFALDTAVAANLLCTLSPGSRRLLDFSNPVSLGQVAPASRMKALTDRMAGGEVSALILYRANPVYSLPASWGIRVGPQESDCSSSASPALPDETTRLATLLMPSHTFLESWGDYRPQRNVRGLLQPAMGPLFDTRPLGDMLLSLGKEIGGQAAFPENSFYDVLRNGWEQGRREQGDRRGLPGCVLAGMRAAGRRCGGRPQKRRPGPGRAGRIRLSPLPAAGHPSKNAASFGFFTYPTIRFFDGRLANRPFLQEMPDPVTMVTWDGWVEINPETAKKMAIQKGDVVVIRAGGGSVEAPASALCGHPGGTLAMPIGYGHGASFGQVCRPASAGNPNELFSGQLDPAGGLSGRSPG